MKKLLTFLFALIMISNLSFGQGNYFKWTGLGDGVSWNQAANWTAPAALPYAEAGGASTWPGQSASGDYAVFANGTLNFITNVPTITLGRLEILPLNIVGNPPAATFVWLSGVADGDIITMRSPSAGIIAQNTFWIVKIEENCFLDLTGAVNPNRVKMICDVGAHFWHKNGATFNPAQYTTCNNEKGFILLATASNHAEYIQQELANQPVRGWVQYIFDDNKHHYFGAPIISVWPAIGDPEFGLQFCRKHNTICVFEGDYVRKYTNGIGWDNWLGNCNPILANPIINFEEGRGYHYFGNSANHPDGLYEIYGDFNTQSSPTTFLKLDVTAAGWNLVGNPFASAITFAEPSGLPTAGPGWSWDLTLNDPTAYYWDNAMNGYHHYNWYTGVGNGPIAERRLLARSQGFFIFCASWNPPASQVYVGNLARVFRGEFQIAKSVVGNNMNLTLNDASGKYLDDAIIGFRDDANGTEFNRLLDAYKLFNEISNASQVYFKTTNNVDVAVKTLKLESGKIMFPLYMKVVNTGTYSIEAKDISTFSANTGITLKDNKTNTTVDLKANPVYTFTATAGDDDARFSLYFSDVLYGINNLNDNTFNIYSYDNSIYIQNNDLKSTTGKVMVYDMIGKQLMNEQLNGNAITRINTNLNRGFYVVSVRTDLGVYNQKVYIN